MHDHDHASDAAATRYEDVCLSVEVSCKDSSYNCYVGLGTLDMLGDVVKNTTKAKRALVISDTNVSAYYGEYAVVLLQEAGFGAWLTYFEAGEQSKTLETLEGLLDAAAACELDRDDVIVALGGGVVGDIAGMCAGLYMRGISVVQVPTSLLAMVDSSVGGKTAVDLSSGKNLAGLFLQPKAVLADIDCLDTIEPTLLHDSMGEVIKHALLKDPELFFELGEANIVDPDFDRVRLANIIKRNIEIKRDVVESDEFERGLRKTLNLGHTFGHAIEAASNFELGHGSSVSAGLCIMARAAAKQGKCTEDLVSRLEQTCELYGLPTTTDVATDVLMDYITHDKKKSGDSITIAVPYAAGDVRLEKVDLSELRELLELGR